MPSPRIVRSNSLRDCFMSEAIPSETFHNAILAREAFSERISRLKAAGWEEVPEKV